MSFPVCDFLCLTQSVIAVHCNRGMAIASATTVSKKSFWRVSAKLQKEKERHLKNSICNYCSLIFILLYREAPKVKAFVWKTIWCCSKIPFEVGSLHIYMFVNKSRSWALSHKCLLHLHAAWYTSASSSQLLPRKSLATVQEPAQARDISQSEVKLRTHFWRQKELHGEKQTTCSLAH